MNNVVLCCIIFFLCVDFIALVTDLQVMSNSTFVCVFDFILTLVITATEIAIVQLCVLTALCFNFTSEVGFLTCHTT